MNKFLTCLNMSIERDLLSNQLKQLVNSAKQNNRTLKVLLAVSGGIDSVCLLDGFYQLQKNHNIDISVAHIHHGLQKNADQWLGFVQQQAHIRKVNFYFQHLNLKDISSNIEGQAREARYQALKNIAQEIGAQVIATAHHGHDQLETFLLQWFRGAGLAGLSSMPTIKNAAPIFIWRPFLNLLKADIEQYARDRDLSWVEDPSNQSLDFARNRMRKLITHISSQPQAKPEKLLHSIDVLGQSYQELLALQNAVYQPLLNTANQLSLQQLNELSESLRKPALRYLLLHWFETDTLTIRQTHWLERVWSAIQTQQHQQWQITDHWHLIYDGTRLYKQASIDKSVFIHANQTLNISPEHLQILDQTQQVQIELSPWNAKLHITSAPSTPLALIHKELLNTGLFELRIRTGGEMIRTHPKRPNKKLKHIWQEQKISDHARQQAPLLYLNNQLLCVLGAGLNLNHPDAVPPGFENEQIVNLKNKALINLQIKL